LITIDITTKDVANTHTYELSVQASDGKPFVKDANDVFLNIASPADMLLVPDAPGASMYRDDHITMIFRDKYTREFSIKNIEEQIAELNSINLTEQNGVTLFDNTI